MQYKTVRDNLQRTLDGEDCGEKVVKIIQNLKEKDQSNKIKFLSNYEISAKR